MSYDVHDTIAAVASAPGGAARGLVRISGPATLERLAHCFVAQSGAELAKLDRPTRVNGSFRVRTETATGAMQIPGALLVWPGKRSYTKEPSAEFHTIGSPPLLAAVVEELGRHGVRPAAPGEFTLRAFLGGRIDLIQAEGVLGVIDARPDELGAALDQLAGGISLPLRRIREDLLSLLAELEAGLDFVEEDIEFISRESLAERLAHAQQVVSSTQAQLAARDRRNEAPRVALVGPPNAGKSSLFNALAERFGERDAAKSIVSAQPGATRDYVICRLDVGGTTCELIDTAGTVEVNEADARGDDRIQSATQMATSRQRRAADVRLICADARYGANIATGFGEIGVLTKIDLLSESEASASLAPGSLSPATTQGALRDPVGCSAVTGAGLEVLASQIRAAIGRMTGEHSKPVTTAATANRCRESLRQTAASLETAVSLVGAGADELLAAEIRTGLDGLGQVVGAICADDILDRVFGQFCIGK